MLPYRGVWPKLAADVFLAPGAVVVGDVEIGAGSSVWYNAVVRGDVGRIRIGAGANIQDGTVVHVTGGAFDTVIGDEVLVGHRCMIHGCRLENRAFIGMSATVLDGCVVEGGGMLAAGSLLAPGRRLPKGELWAGAPARKMRDLDPAALEGFRRQTAHYAWNARVHRDSLEGLEAPRQAGD